MSSGDKVITRVCPQCGRVLEEGWKSCPYCGWSGAEVKSPTKKRTMSRISIILGVVSFIVAGIPLGIGAIFCGALAISRDEDKLGIVGIILGIIGIILALMVLPLFLSVL
jgi:uncharacterized membrane protein YvbJ